MNLPLVGRVNFLWFAIGVAFALFAWPWISNKFLS